MTTEQDQLYEFQVFGSSFRVPGAIERFVNELAPSDIGLIHGQTGVHEVFRALASFHNKIGGELVDPLAFKVWLRDETDILDALGGQSGVDQLVKISMETELSDLDTIIKMVEFRGKKRRQLDAVYQMQHLLANKATNNDDDLTKLAKLSEEIIELNSDLSINPLASVRTANDIGNDADKLWETPNFMPTQYPSLNKAIGYSETKGGFLRGTVNAIAAMSGFGKSTLIKNIVNHYCDNGETILFINYEEPQEHWERILMAQLLGVNVYEQTDRLSTQKKQSLTAQFEAKMKEWGNRFMVRHDPDTLFFEDLEKWLRDILGYGARKPSVIVIDTIQSLFTKSGGRARWGDFEQIMVSLEKLAKDMDAAIFITAQQNSTAVKEGRDVLNQGDMGGSLTIIQKSTVALFLVPMKDSSDDATINSNIMEIQIPKNRITGQTQTSNPPKVVYDDSMKSYKPFILLDIPEPNIIDDEDYGATY